MTSGRRAKSSRSRGEILPSEFDRPRIDFLILADRAEGINGKLYLMGGGWNEIGVSDFGQPVSLSLAVGVLVPWNATNELHALTIFIETEEGTRLAPEISAQLNIGRPPGAVPGQSFRALIAVNGAWKLPQAGGYRAVAVLGNGDRKTASFLARDVPGLMLPNPPA